MDKIKQLKKLRQKQSDLKFAILSLEQDIIKEVPGQKLEGVTKTSWGSITNKLTRKLDYEAYNAFIAKGIPAKFHFVDYAPKIDLKKLRALELVRPEIVSRCITTKPAKTTITIKEVKK